MMKDLLPDQFAQLSIDRQVQAIIQAAPYLADKLAQHCQLGSCSTEQALTEVLRFLLLSSKGKALTPSHRVDLVWHQFILATRVYSEFCTKCYDNYLHHTPSNDSLENQQQFQLCLTLYRQAFGTPNVWFWGPDMQVSIAGDCAGCESC